MLTIRKATPEELSTPVERIKWSTVERKMRSIERKNLNSFQSSTSWGSMNLPTGIVECVQADGPYVDIHTSWRKALEEGYAKDDKGKVVNPVLVPVVEQQ